MGSEKACKRFDAADLEMKAAEVACILRSLGNERRLLILCKLAEWGETNVNTLAKAVDLSQSALSQHLAKMREEGLLSFRRDGQTLWYRIEDRRVLAILSGLHDVFCCSAE